MGGYVVVEQGKGVGGRVCKGVSGGGGQGGKERK